MTLQTSQSNTKASPTPRRHVKASLRKAVWLQSRKCAGALLLFLGKCCISFVWLLWSWVKDFAANFNQPSGWVSLGKAIVMGAGALGIILTVGTLNFQMRTYQRDVAERSYTQFVSDLNSSSTDVRIGALARFPELIGRMIPTVPKTDGLSMLRELMPMTSKDEARFAEDVRRHVSFFLKRRSKNILGVFETNGAPTSAEELEIVMRGLSELGPGGWYGTSVVVSSKSKTLRDSYWTWIWGIQPEGFHGTPANKLLCNAYLHRPRFSHLPLEMADFRESRMQLPDFSYARLNKSYFNGAELEKADFTAAELELANFSESILSEPSFSKAKLRRATFQKAVLKNAKLIETDLTGANFKFADLSGGRLINARSGSRVRAQALARDNFIVFPVFPNPFLNGSKLIIGGMTCRAVQITDTMLAVEKQPGLLPGELYDIKIESNSVPSKEVFSTSFFSATLRDVDLSSAQLWESNFDQCDLTGAELRKCLLAYCSAQKAVFRNVNFASSTLDGSDLRDADFAGAVGLEAIASCRGANIAGVLGISPETRQVLLNLGAVNISNSMQWQHFQAANYDINRRSEFEDKP